MRVEGGAEHGPAGQGYWSRRFVGLLKSFAEDGRLPRGRSQVLELRVRPYEVSATVRSSQLDVYEVTLGIDAINERDWADVEEALAYRAVFRAQLLTGEMPPEIEQIFAEFGVSLFPESAADLHIMCGCSEWREPCKHAAAVLWVLAEAFDEDPFLILAWNGRTREELLTALRRNPPSAADPLVVPDVPLTAEHFWTPATGLARLRERPPVPTVPPGLLLQLVEPPQVKIRRRGLADVLAPAYDALAHQPEDSEP